MSLIQIDNEFWEIIREEPGFIYAKRKNESSTVLNGRDAELKLSKEANTWVVSGVTKTPSPVIRILSVPFNLLDMDDSLLFPLLEYLQIIPGEQFWEDRLEEHYGKKFRRARASTMTAEQQYRDLYRINRILNSPLFNRNYSDLEASLPLDKLTENDRVDLLMLLPLNLISKYENLRYRLRRDQKFNVLNWLQLIDPQIL